MTRTEALDFLHKHIQNINLIRHCLAVEAGMRALARYFQEDEEKWGLAGLLHDADYEETKDSPQKHVLTVVSWLKKMSIEKEIIQAIYTHGWGYIKDCPSPATKMEWGLYCIDELTGLIVAVALVKGRSLANVSVQSVLKKFPEKSFAARVNREQIKKCEEHLRIPLSNFIQIVLSAMQEVSKDLGL